jgi:hypothetical protein
MRPVVQLHELLLWHCDNLGLLFESMPWWAGTAACSGKSGAALHSLHDRMWHSVCLQVVSGSSWCRVLECAFVSQVSQWVSGLDTVGAWPITQVHRCESPLRHQRSTRRLCAWVQLSSRFLLCSAPPTQSQHDRTFSAVMRVARCKPSRTVGALVPEWHISVGWAAVSEMAAAANEYCEPSCSPGDQEGCPSRPVTATATAARDDGAARADRAGLGKVSERARIYMVR